MRTRGFIGTNTIVRLTNTVTSKSPQYIGDLEGPSRTGVIAPSQESRFITSATRSISAKVL